MFHKQINLSWRAALFFLIIWLMGASLLLDFWPFIRSEGEWATIAHTEYGFAVDYPTKWVAKTYSEHGFKGNDDLKLQIYPSLLGDTYISFYYRTSQDPNLERVTRWGDNEIDRFRDNEDFEEYPLEEATLRGHPILRRKYRTGNLMFEDVYIARSNDLIIITMQSSISDFEEDYDEFEAIVASFRPLD